MNLQNVHDKYKCRNNRIIKYKYFESTLRHFGVFIVKLQPLLHDTADAGLRVVDELEAGDVGSAFPQVCQVDVQETLRCGVTQTDCRK